MISRLGIELSMEQQNDLGLDNRTFSKVKNMVLPSEQDLSRIYKLVLDVYEHAKSAADEDFVVEVLLVHIIKTLQRDEVGTFPLIMRYAKNPSPRPAA